MVWKILTNIREMLNRRTEAEAITEAPIIMASGRQMLMLQQIQVQTQRTALKTLDVAGLLRAYRLRQITEVLPALRSIEIPKLAQQVIPFTVEEETKYKRTAFGLRQMQIERPKRYLEVLMERRLAEIEQLHIDKEAVLHIEVIIQAMFERLLWTTRQLQVLQVLQQLLQMSEAKQRYLTPMLGLISLQKLLLNYYVPYFMEVPLKHNMLGLVVSMMTMQALRGKSVSVYASMAGQGQAIKQKSVLISCERQVPRTKAVAKSKTKTEWWETVVGLFETLDFQLSSLVPLFTDWKGTPLRTVTLLQVLGHNYLISKNFATHVGMPENKWYYTYPRLEVVVTRRGLRLHKKMRIPESQALRLRRDDYIATMRKWRGTHG